MDCRYHVPPRFLLNVVQEGTELIFTPSCLNIPRRFGLSYYDDILSSRIYIGTIPVNRRWLAVEGWRSIDKARKVTMPM